MVTEITIQNLDEVLAAETPAVIDFWAEWCGPCRMMSPVVDELAEQYAGKITVGKCNVDEQGDIAVKYLIRSIPTIFFFKGGQIVDKQVGAVSKSELAAKFEKLL